MRLVKRRLVQIKTPLALVVKSNILAKFSVWNPAIYNFTSTYQKVFSKPVFINCPCFISLSISLQSGF